MFDISWGELLLIGAVALIVIGPKELPAVLRTVGQWMTKLRRMANEFQGQFQEAIREAEMADLKKEVDDLATQAKSYTHFDPLADVQKEIEKSMADKPAEAATAVTEQPAEAAAAAETPLIEPIRSEPAVSGRTPADAAVESAMRAVAELNAEMPVPDAGGDFAAPPPPAIAAPPAVETVAAPPPVEIVAAPVPNVEAAAPPALEPAPTPPPAPAKPAVAAVVLDEDDWPVPANFKEPLGPKRNTGSG
jgi:sec-independent protein translocase protein TatB